MATGQKTEISRRKRSRILLVDDHPLVRERLAELINRELDLTVCAEADDRHDAIEMVRLHHPTLVIVDITLKHSDGVELIKDLHVQWPGLLMLVVSMHDESLYAERVLRAGARGYITKQEATRSILRAIRRVLAGQFYLSETVAPQVLGRLTDSPSGGGSEPVECLADRELQVFELTGHGFNTRQIAKELNIGVKTVETYRHRIREKLKVEDPTDLLQQAILWAHHSHA